MSKPAKALSAAHCDGSPIARGFRSFRRVRAFGDARLHGALYDRERHTERAALQDSSAGLHRRIKHYTHPQLLCIDEVGYLSYDSRYADLLFEVVTRRYEALKPVELTTNKPFSEWPDVFPHAACVVTLVDRLIHRCEVLHIEGQSYRAKEAKERAAAKKALKPNETRPDLRPSE